MAKRFLYVAIALIIILFITNPSLKSFKEAGHYGRVERESNFLIFSIFRHYDRPTHTTPQGTDYIIPDEFTSTLYVGILENFFKI